MYTMERWSFLIRRDTKHTEAEEIRAALGSAALSLPGVTAFMETRSDGTPVGSPGDALSPPFPFSSESNDQPNDEQLDRLETSYELLVIELEKLQTRCSQMMENHHNLAEAHGQMEDHYAKVQGQSEGDRKALWQRLSALEDIMQRVLGAFASIHKPVKVNSSNAGGDDGETSQTT